MTELPQVPRQRCIYLQSKAMAIHGEGFADDPEYQEGSGHFWCIETGRGLGPDNGTVGMKDCCDPDRECYREF